jgi:DNA transposition AAA+ family ATPase
MITGPSGCGKTAAVRRWLKMRHEADAIFISANGCMTRKSILRRIAKELGLYTKADADTLIERITADLRQDSRLVIIDEADQICTELKLETLRSLIDGADGEAGIVLVGNEDLSEKILSMAVDKRKLARIHNRFGANQRVRMPTESEAARWLRRVNLAPGARKRLVKILMSSSGMGGWRVCRTILHTIFAAVQDREITEELLLSDSLQNVVLSLNA